MALSALFIPAVPVAASLVDPVPHDVACNNTNSGADSPLVSLTISSAGLTVHWSQAEPPNGFGTDGTVVVRACVVEDGELQGAWSQNDSNDGIELFPWTLFEMDENPCPGNVTFNGSVDGGTPFVVTQKQNGNTCTALPTLAPTPTPTTAPTATPAPTEAPTGSPAPTEAPTGSPAPTEAPTGSPAPTETTAPTPTGGVGGATGTPPPAATADPTLPTTSTLDGTGSGPTSDGWRLILLAMAGLLAAALLLTPARAVVRKDDASR